MIDKNEPEYLREPFGLWQYLTVMVAALVVAGLSWWGIIELVVAFCGCGGKP
jgi:hypothetical protein